MSREVWAQIPRAPRYEASSCGKIRLIDGAVRKQQHDDRGRASLRLNYNGRIRTKRVHTLVLEAFAGLCPDGLEACHNDGNPSNNRLENLRWDTHRNNERDKIRHGTLVIPTNKFLTPEDMRAIRSSEQSVREIASQFRCSAQHVYRIRSNKMGVVSHFPR